jgi:hypothetical protein
VKEGEKEIQKGEGGVKRKQESEERIGDTNMERLCERTLVVETTKK